jgi:hypothetical protein
MLIYAQGTMRILFKSFLTEFAIVWISKELDSSNALSKNAFVNDILHCFVLRSIQQRNQIIVDNLNTLFPL